jgi:hypothetical protein
MTWRFAIIRTKPNEYSLHSVYIKNSGATDYYSEVPTRFTIADTDEFDGDDEAGRALLIRLLSEALEDARSTPILSIDGTGALIVADPI